jgi:protein-S-isoprenylcysteine O-methyltransferase Ste14
VRWLRLRAVWLLILPFLWLADPTPGLLAAGGALAAVGLALRAWAAGHIRKEKELTTTGPYAHTRNPLYVGSFFLGLGVTVAGGHWLFVILFLLFFVLVYGRTIRGEAGLLEEMFGPEYRHYAERVPLVVPRLTPYRAPDDEGRGGRPFELERWRRNREYEALLGTVAGFAFLAAKMVWL